MIGQQPDMIDGLQGKLPPLVKWCLAGVGAVGGFQYAQLHGSPIPQSCIVAGAAAGFGFILVIFAGLRLARLALIGAAVLVVVNYALLIPYGHGDHMPGWVRLGRSAGFSVLDAVLRLVNGWGRYAR